HGISCLLLTPKLKVWRLNGLMIPMLILDNDKKRTK
ncbi:MAG: hypothetical protein ACI9C4_000439, partial [Paraglaciecola sp.]